MSTLISNFVSRTSVPLKRWQRPKPCWCTGYWFPHRTGGGACEHSKTRDIHLAIRHKDNEALLDATLEFVLKYPGKPYFGPCPF
jgi:hypothetical protein